MRVLLQSKDSGMYVKEVGLMTNDPAEAKDFLSSTRAIEFCTTHKVIGMQIVLRFPEQHYDIVLPMVAGRRPASTRPASAY